MADKTVGIFNKIDLTNNNNLGNKLYVSGHIIPAGWTNNNNVTEDLINGNPDNYHENKLLDSIFIDWNGAFLEGFYGRNRTINTTADLLDAVKNASLYAIRADQTWTPFSNTRWETVIEDETVIHPYKMTYPIVSQCGIKHSVRNFQGNATNLQPGFSNEETNLILQTGYWADYDDNHPDKTPYVKSEFLSKDLRMQYWFSKYDPRIPSDERAFKVVLLDDNNNSYFPVQVNTPIINIKDSNNLPAGRYENGKFIYEPEDEIDNTILGPTIKAQLAFNGHKVLGTEDNDSIGSTSTPIYWNSGEAKFKTINLNDLINAILRDSSARQTLITALGEYFIPTGSIIYIKFDGNGGTIDGEQYKTIMISNTSTIGSQLPDNDNMYRDGYNFIGWFTAASGGTRIESSASPTENVTYFAHWSQIITYTVTFNANGGTPTPDAQTVNAGAQITLPSGLTRNADSSYTYTFAGWNTNDAGTGTNYNAGSNYTVNSSTTLWANWNKTAIPATQYTVTFNANGGTPIPEAQTVNAGTQITLPSGLTRNADSSYTYTFAGWNTNDAGTGTNYNTGSNYTVNSSTTLWANWNKTAIPATTYKYYAGVTDRVSFTESDLNQTSTTKPTTLTFGDAEGDNYQTFVYPSSWGKPTSMMAGGLDGKDGWFWGDEAEMESLPSGYTATIHQGGPVTYEITW